MSDLRKITVRVPADILAKAQAHAGSGVTETVRTALKKLASMQAQQELCKVRGKVKFSLTGEELKHDRE